PVPVGLDVFGRAADLCDREGHAFGRHHFDRVPRADREFVRVCLLLRNMDAHLATDAALQIDLAPLLRSLDDAAVDLSQLNTVDRADLQTRLAAGAVVGVDDGELFRNFFARSFFGHESSRELRVESREPEARQTFPRCSLARAIYHTLSLPSAPSQAGLNVAFAAAGGTFPSR